MDTNEVINRRNTQTVFQELKEQNAKILQQQQTINSLQAVVSGLSQRLSLLETMCNYNKAMSIGHGPSTI